MGRFFRICLGVFLAFAGNQTLAQEQTRQFAAPVGGILVVDQEALFTLSMYGKRVLSEIDTARNDLVEENRQIETELVAEERALTEQRATLDSDEFRRLADEFDQKVQQIRAEQDAKNDVIAAGLEEARRFYFQTVVPVLAGILRDEGAVAILDKRTILLSVNLIDITDRAVGQIDALIGDGSTLGQDGEQGTDP